MKNKKLVDFKKLKILKLILYAFIDLIINWIIREFDVVQKLLKPINLTFFLVTHLNYLFLHSIYFLEKGINISIKNNKRSQLYVKVNSVC